MVAMNLLYNCFNVHNVTKITQLHQMHHTEEAQRHTYLRIIYFFALFIASRLTNKVFQMIIMIGIRQQRSSTHCQHAKDNNVLSN